MGISRLEAASELEATPDYGPDLRESLPDPYHSLTADRTLREDRALR